MNLLRGILSALFLFSTLLLFNLIQTLSLLIKPFSSAAFRSVNRWAAGTWWGWCVTSGEKVQRVEIIISGDDLPHRENSIVVLNHQRMTDIPIVLAIAKQKGSIGDLKWFVKDILKYVPGVGWGMLFLDCLFIKRNWTTDQEYIHRVFDKILTHSIPLWLVAFVEGTRFTPEKRQKTHAYAKTIGVPPPRHVLIPRTKGFVASFQSLGEHIDAVYDLTIGYTNTPPTLWQWVKGEVQSVHLHVRRFSAKELPSDDEALSNWLINLFSEKDELLEGFYTQGVFSPI